jgi:hypothetical protein
MAKGLRFSLDLFIPENATGTLMAGVRIPNAVAARIPDMRTKIRALKPYARKINEVTTCPRPTLR